jgi:hypothetical protein
MRRAARNFGDGVRLAPRSGEYLYLGTRRIRGHKACRRLVTGSVALDTMKTLLTLLGATLTLSNVGILSAQEVAASVEATAAPEPMIAAAARFDATQLDELLGPVALYPDALMALVLPASAASSDVVLAARYLRDGGDPAQVENQPWDESVRSLARYPEVIKWMDENLAWTKQLGEAFVAQPAEVMNAVQRLRARAQAAGTLASTPQQQVVVEQSTISIVPAQPDVIYVPYYDPAVVYVSHPRYYSDPFIQFGPAYSTGFWLSYNLDWSSRRVCYVNFSDRQRYWRERPDYWRRPYFSNRPGYVSPPVHTWTPRASSTYATRHAYTPRASTAVVQPNISRQPLRSGSDYRRDYSGPRTTSSAPANNLPNAAFARSMPAPVLPNAPVPQLRLNNPLPQPLPAPLPATTPQTVTRPSGSYARSTPDNDGHALRHHGAPAPVVGPTVPNYHPNAPAAIPPQTAAAYQHSTRFQAPAAAAPVVVAPPAHAAAYQHSPRFQSPPPSAPAVVTPAPTSVAPAPAAPAAAPAANGAPANGRGSDNGNHRGRDRFEH